MASSAISYLLPLNEVGYKQLSLVGGKAASLGEMLKAGLPVPSGFVITTDAYKQGSLKSLKSDLLKAFDELGAKRVAVRSSAVAEDSGDASWAGQLDTALNVTRDGLLDAVEYCWQSILSNRAQSYAKDHKISKSKQAVAVVVQAMVNSDTAGVMFTANPISENLDQCVIEAVFGLGELLVQGVVTPASYVMDKKSGKVVESSKHHQAKKLIYKAGQNQEIKVTEAGEVLAAKQLKDLLDKAKQIETYYGKPQDIEFAFEGGELYIVQSRPITSMEARAPATALGEPDELFYWGPSRATTLYMSDFMEAEEKYLTSLAGDPKMPNPPKSLVMFRDKKMVWLSNAKAFSKFTADMFMSYQVRDRFDNDLEEWRKVVRQLENADGPELVKGWKPTLFAEFALYGAERSITHQLLRFESKMRQEIWDAFTVPDELTFIAKIDQELVESADPATMASKYPWIDDGYRGVANKARQYFTDRLEMLKENPSSGQDKRKDRGELAKKFGLKSDELKALTLVRQLAEFMDERKAWMMRTRRNMTKSAGKIEYGWLFDKGKVTLLNERATEELWERYINFKSSNSVVSGVVACNGNHHFANGKVHVVHSPTDNVPNDRILVVTATSPSYVPLMRTARALITDHGGMMSHAAIVARELNLPCIVGTHHGTKVLKDGDKVVMDLVKGEVSK